MSQQFSQHELEAYLDEALSPAEMSAIEAQLRKDKDLVRQLATINGRRDAGVHTIAEIWRRHRISCPTRAQLGNFLLDALDQELADYIQFHVTEVGCRFCHANLEDLKLQQQETAKVKSTRRAKYFQSSAGYLRKK